MVSLRRRRLMGFTVGAAPDLPDNLHLPEDAPPRTEPVTANRMPTVDETPQAINPNPPEAATLRPIPVNVNPVPKLDQRHPVTNPNIPADVPSEPVTVNLVPSVDEKKPAAEVCISLPPTNLAEIRKESAPELH